MDLIINFDNTSDKQALHATLKQLTGKKLIKIESFKNKRSISQNNYYWGVVLKYVAVETGFTVDEAHQVLTKQFLGYEKVNSKTGEIIDLVKSTKKLSTVDFEEYLERVRQWALNFLDCKIPLPNESI